MNNIQGHLWHTLFNMLYYRKEDREMVEVVATLRNKEGIEIKVKKDNATGEVVFSWKIDSGLIIDIQANGNDLVQAIMAVGGLFGGTPMNMPGMFTYITNFEEQNP